MAAWNNYLATWNNNLATWNNCLAAWNNNSGTWNVTSPAYANRVVKSMFEWTDLDYLERGKDTPGLHRTSIDINTMQIICLTVIIICLSVYENVKVLQCEVYLYVCFLLIFFFPRCCPYLHLLQPLAITHQQRSQPNVQIPPMPLLSLMDTLMSKAFVWNVWIGSERCSEWRVKTMSWRRRKKYDAFRNVSRKSEGCMTEIRCFKEKRCKECQILYKYNYIELEIEEFWSNRKALKRMTEIVIT